MRNFSIQTQSVLISLTGALSTNCSHIVFRIIIIDNVYIDRCSIPIHPYVQLR